METIEIIKECIKELVDAFNNDINNDIFITESDVRCYLYMLLFKKFSELNIHDRIRTEKTSPFYMNCLKLDKIIEKRVPLNISDEDMALINKRKAFIKGDGDDTPDKNFEKKKRYYYMLAMDREKRDEFMEEFRKSPKDDEIGYPVSQGSYDMAIVSKEDENKILSLIEFKYQPDQYLSFYRMYNDFFKVSEVTDVSFPCCIIFSNFTEEFCQRKHENPDKRMETDCINIDKLSKEFGVRYVFVQKIKKQEEPMKILTDIKKFDLE